MKRATQKRLPALLASACLLLALAACSEDAGKSGYSVGGDYGGGGEAVVSPQPLQEGGSQAPLDYDYYGAPGYGARDYRVKLKGGGEDVVTFMFYLCGSDLESESGFATGDLYEIMEADISERLNIVVETGGAESWANNFVDPDTNERWLITNDGIEFLEDVGKRDMTDADTLQDFIEFSVENFPADRYILVVWDHGGGTVEGCFFDERFIDDEDSWMMSISEFGDALEGAGVFFDMIGFDCCLMGTVETAFVLERYADFMVASQRVEPGDGWYYTPWIDALSENTSMPTPQLGQIIVDSYISESSYSHLGNELTLSVTDLTYIPILFDAMNSFFAEAQEDVATGDFFVSTSQALAGSRAIIDDYDLVDLGCLVGDMQGSDELIQALGYCVVYNGATIADHNGLCIYFPYTDLSAVGGALEIYEEIGIDGAYQEFIATFANVMVGGQFYNSGGGSNPLGGQDDFDYDYWMDYHWVDDGLFSQWEDFYWEFSYDGTELEIVEKGDDFALVLSDDDWELITGVELCVYLDDGEGFVELGADNVYEFDDDGDLLISFDNTWVALDGQLVCYYVTDEIEDDDYWYTCGVVPIYYKDREAELVVAWDSHKPGGYVVGWRFTDLGSGSQKGLFGLHDGMEFDFLCDYYTYDGEYEDQYLWGGMIVDGEVEVSYEDVGDDDCLVFYVLYDVYGNTYWTEAVIYSLYW